MITFGPFVHALNKGGLDDIVEHSRLVSTTARGIAGGADAVRAHQGSFFDLYQFRNWGHEPDSNRVFIEFTTEAAPSIAGPPGKHALVFWQMPAGQYLPIKITGVYNGLRQKIG